MTCAAMTATPTLKFENSARLSVQMCANTALQRIDAAGVMLNLFPGNEVEGGPANIWLRLTEGESVQAVPLLGPQSPLVRVAALPDFTLQGQWQGLHLQLQLRLAASTSAYFWHLHVENRGALARTIDLSHVQDVGLSDYGAARVNEYYVSHYLDLAPLAHPRQGWMLAARQNLAVEGKRFPWALLGSLRRGVSFATDVSQVSDMKAGLPGLRLQHEHALLALQDAAVTLVPGASETLGFFMLVHDNHAEASSTADLAHVDEILALPEARATLPLDHPISGRPSSAGSLFSHAPWLPSLDLATAELDRLFGTARRHEESLDGRVLSFFHAADAHVVTRSKELRVSRPHGHMLRSGEHLVPDETALTSTVWMNGVFHSLVTQGHVGSNRLLSTVRSYLGLFRSQGQRVFVRIDGHWQQLGRPSAFEIEPGGCRWLYRHAQGLIEVRSGAVGAPHRLTLRMRVIEGAPTDFLVTHHLALAGDDGEAGPAPAFSREQNSVRVCPPPGSEMAERFPEGGFRISANAALAQVGGDEMLFTDGQSRGLPFLCIASAQTQEFELTITGELITQPPVPHGIATLPRLSLPVTRAASAMTRLAEMLPWFRHNALIHYLSPRGLEQFSGGGWGTRDVCQGPTEMLLALDHTEPVRDLVLRVFTAQNPDGDWPQWFMFFPRDAHVRAGDSHGDIVFWPLVALGRYLLASGDASLLDEVVPFHGAAAKYSVWHHVERALGLISERLIAGTQLVAYGHGDWNDSLQPADPSLREHMCSAWTVTLHHQMLTTLARAVATLGRDEVAIGLLAQADLVRADFQRLLVAANTVAGYALFEPDDEVQLLLHPKDKRTGLKYSLLPMMHGVMEDMFTPEQARHQLSLIDEHMTGPDGARLFDRPLTYSGGPEHLFRRAESSAFFGREIGVMYMHAHLRFAEMLAHMGEAERFFEALGRAVPIGLTALVPSASLRQSNCYYSSSDAAFADRYEAQEHYERINQGTVTLDGGWRIYSSGPGIALGLVVTRLLGIRREHSTLIVDPVMPASLYGLRAQISLAGQQVEVEYQMGATGCGPTSLELNGQPLAFTRGHNPYRTGAAMVPMAALSALLQSEAINRLVIK